MSPLTSSRRRALAALGTTALAGFAGCHGDVFAPDSPDEVPPSTIGSDTSSPSGVWTMPDGNRRRSRYAPVTPVRDPVVRWHAPVSGSVGAVTDEHTYLSRTSATGESATLVAHRLRDGTVVWESEVDHTLGPPGLFDASLYASGDGRVRRFDTAGRPQWDRDLYGRLSERVHDSFLPRERADLRVSSPVVADGVVHVTSTFGLHGLDAETGRERWRLWVEDTPRAIRSPTVASEGVYFLGRDDSGEASVSGVFDETPVRLTSGLDLYGSPISLGSDHAFAGPAERAHTGQPGTLLATPRVASEGGFADAQAWWFVGHHTSAPLGRETTAPVVGPERVFVGDVVEVPDGLRAAVYAVDPSTGTVTWRHRLDVENTAPAFDPSLLAVVSTLAGADGVVYAGVAPMVDASPADPGLVTREAGVLALAADSGERLWFQRVGFLPRGLAAVDAHVVAWDHDGNLAVVGERR